MKKFLFLFIFVVLVGCTSNTSKVARTDKMDVPGVVFFDYNGTLYDDKKIFDEGYIYYFTEGNGEETCDKMAIDSGDLNSMLFFYFVDGEDVALYTVYFAWQRRPEHLIYRDEDGFEWDYYSTNLNRALNLRDSKEIYDYF